MLTNLLSNRKHQSLLQSDKIHGDPAFCPLDDRVYFESAAEKLLTDADEWERGSRSGSSTSRFSDFVQDLTGQGDGEYDEGLEKNTMIHGAMSLCSGGESRQDDELSAADYEDSDCYDHDSQHDCTEVGKLDNNTHSEKPAVSSSKYYAGSGYSVSDDQYPGNSDGILYRNEKYPRSPSYTTSTGSTHLHCKNRDKLLSAQIMESKTKNSRKNSVKKAPFDTKCLLHPKHSRMVETVLLSSRPYYGPPVRNIASFTAIGLQQGSRPKSRHIPGCGIRNCREEIFTRASLTLPRSKSKKTSRLVCDEVPFQSSDIFSSGLYGFLSKSGVSGHDIGSLDNKYLRGSKVQDLLKKEVRGIKLKLIG